MRGNMENSLPTGKAYTKLLLKSVLERIASRPLAALPYHEPNITATEESTILRLMLFFSSNGHVFLGYQ